MDIHLNKNLFGKVSLGNGNNTEQQTGEQEKKEENLDEKNASSQVSPESVFEFMSANTIIVKTPTQTQAEALAKAIKEMGLRKTNYSGVYCEQHNPNMPAGNYTHQRHYYWDSKTLQMVLIPNLYNTGDNKELKSCIDYYNETGKMYGKDGYDEDGYDKEGYNKDGFDRDGNVLGGFSTTQRTNNNGASLDYSYTTEQIDENTSIRHVEYLSGEKHDDTYVDGKIVKQEGTKPDGTTWTTIYDGDFGKPVSQRYINNNGDITFKIYDENNNAIDVASYTHNSNGTITMYGYDDNGNKYEINTFKEDEIALMNLVSSPVSGIVSENQSNGNVEHYYYDSNDTPVYYDTFDKSGKLIGRSYYRYDTDGNYIGCDSMKIGNDGKVTNIYSYDKDGILQTETEFSYFKSSYERTVRMYKDGYVYKTRDYYYDKTGRATVICTNEWDKNGKWIDPLKTAGEKNQDANISLVLQFGASAASSLSGYGKIGLTFLSLAGNERNCMAHLKQYVGNYTAISYGDEIYKKYSNHLETEIYRQITEEYGYTPKDLKGYYFNADTTLAKLMAKNKDLLNIVKKNKDLLLNGFSTQNGDKAIGFNFTKANSADLYYAISGCYIIESWTDDNGKLHLILADTYDFAGEGHGTGHGDLCAAGDAEMKRGRLIPFYTVTEVVIDPSQI